MTENIDIIKLIKGISRIERIPEKFDHPENFPYFEKPAKVTVTFIGAVLSGDYVYKMLFPAIALNEYSTTHRAFIVGIKDFDPDKKMDDYTKGFALPETFITISDYMVFPFYTYDLRDIVEQIKKINPKVKIVYCIDLNFMRVPTGYPGYKDYESRADQDVIIENMRASDIVLMSQISLAEFLYTELKDRLAGAPVTLKVMPCGFFPQITEPLIRAEMPELDNTIFRALLISSPTHVDDINCIREQLIALKEKYKEKFEIISFGWKGIADFGKGMKDVFREIPFTYVRPVNFYDYAKTLVKIQPDCLLIPVKLTEDASFTYTSKNYRKFIEASAMGIPCLITAAEPFKNGLYAGDNQLLIQPEVNAILIEKKADWIVELTDAIEDKGEVKKLNRIGSTAYQEAHTRFTYEKIVKSIESIFE